MPVICIGPVCVPLNLFLPFLLGVLHSYGFFKFIKKEWVDYRWYWRHMKRYMGWEEKPKAAAVQTETSSKAAQESTGKTQAMTPEDDNSLTQRRKQSEAVEQR